MSKSRKPRKDDAAAAGSAGKSGRKVRVDFRKNITSKARNKRTWTDEFHDHGYTTKDEVSQESVRAKGSLSRKRTIIEGGELAGLLGGVIVALRGTMADVDAADGKRYRCTIRRVLKTRLTSERARMTVGDRVRFTPADAGNTAPSDTEFHSEGVIEDVEERRTTLTRRYKERVHVIAANVDQAVIVASVQEPEVRPHLIDRFLLAAHSGGMRPVIVLNKMDIDLDESTRELVDDVIYRYRALKYELHTTSTTAALGIDEFRAALTGKTSVVVGMSGVGKSSLLNAVQPGLARRTGEVSDLSRRGQHTTTTAELLALDGGGYVVDTPGIRQYELADIESVEVEAYFPEFIDLIANCKFPDCKHVSETGCAIIAAVEDGTIHPDRFDSYVRIVTQQIDDEASY